MDKIFAIVDIETTGGFAQNHKVVEIAILLTDGQNEIARFESLINPQCHIPQNVSYIHGIYQEDVVNAPTFDQVADKVHDLLKGAVFVAHSVNFDFAFVNRELQEAGYTLNPPKLCTVRLSRKIIPGLKSYSLGAICAARGIEIKARHRAMGDAEATMLLFHQLIALDNEDVISQSMKRNSKEAILPDNLDKQQFEQLPEQTGLYFLKDKKGEIIYIGKAKNIKKRVYSHFSGQSVSLEKQAFQKEVHAVDYELMGNEFLAFIQESIAIKQHWPRYNRSQKQANVAFGIVQYHDQKGYLRLAIARKSKGLHTTLDFPTHSAARKFLFETYKMHELCPKLCGIQQCNEACYDYALHECKGACIGKESAKAYNQRLTEAIKHYKYNTANCLLLGNGRNPQEKSVVWVAEGIYRGYTFIGEDEAIEEINWQERISPQASTAFVQHYIRSTHYTAGQEIIHLTPTIHSDLFQSL